MTNPAAAMRMLITYAICIPTAILVGYLLTNPLDYTTLGFLGFVIALIVSPIFIKWHYPILIFCLAFPAYLFFLKGNPPCWQVAVIISLGIAIVERTLNSEKRFLRAPSMTWALLFTIAMAVVTMELTGGFGLHSLGGEVGGGKKYINLYLGALTFFAIASRGIPVRQRNLFIALFFLSGVFVAISDLFPFLPGPLRYVNLLFPVSAYSSGVPGQEGPGELTRYGAFSGAALAIILFLLARHGLRGVLSAERPWRAVLFVILFIATLLGGFRSTLIGNLMLLTVLFFLEGLHRTRLIIVAAAGLLLAACLVVPFASHLPFTFQRSLAFLPLDISTEARMNAESSSDWRLRIWEAMLPQVPHYLLVGKGYLMTSEDYMFTGRDTAFKAAGSIDASQEGLAISGDYHSGPLSAVITFGVWGAISILAIMAAGLRIMFRNYRYGDPGLRTVNGLLLANQIVHIISFLFVFGSFDNDVGYFAKMAGFSVALNWGVCRPKALTTVHPRIKPLPAPSSAPQPALTT